MWGDLLTVAAIGLVACLVTLAGVTLVVVRRARRSLWFRRSRLLRERWLARSRPRRDLARLRTEVCRARAATTSIMRLLGRRRIDSSLSELHVRLERLAVAVESQLEILHYEPDDGALSAALPPMCRRVDRVLHAATNVRIAASLVLEGCTDHELDDLSRRAGWEVQALRHGREVLARTTAASL